MSDVLPKGHIDNIIKLMVAVVEHVRDCERCRRVYVTTYTAIVEAHREEGIRFPPNPWKVYEQCSRELHACEHFPAGI